MGASKLDNFFIAPGHEFNFNEEIGQIDDLEKAAAVLAWDRIELVRDEHGKAFCGVEDLAQNKGDLIATLPETGVAVVGVQVGDDPGVVVFEARNQPDGVGDVGQPQFRANLSTTWTQGEWEASLFARYTDSQEDEDYGKDMIDLFKKSTFKQ